MTFSLLLPSNLLKLPTIERGRGGQLTQLSVQIFLSVTAARSIRCLLQTEQETKFLGFCTSMNLIFSLRILGCTQIFHCTILNSKGPFFLTTFEDQSHLKISVDRKKIDGDFSSQILNVAVLV